MKKQWWTSRALSIGVALFFLMYIDVVPKMAETSNQARTNLQVVVTGIRKVAGGNQTGPVVGAQVLVKSDVQDEDFEETLSTDPQGVANVSNVPRGSVLIQVTAQGWISAGMRHELTKKEQTVKIEMTAEEGPSPSPTPSTTPSPSPSASPSPTPSANV